jgi:hypothetical protein
MGFWLKCGWAETTPAYDGAGCVGGGGEEGAQQPLQLVLCVLPPMSGRSTEQVLDSLHATEVIAKSLKGLAIKLITRRTGSKCHHLKSAYFSFIFQLNCLPGTA